MRTNSLENLTRRLPVEYEYLLPKQRQATEHFRSSDYTICYNVSRYQF